MLKHYHDLLDKVLVGSKQAYKQFKLVLASSEAPSKQQIADFFFKEHTLSEFVQAMLMNHEVAVDISAWYQAKAFAIHEPITIYLTQLDLLLRCVEIIDLDEKIAKLTELIALTNLHGSLKAKAHNIRGVAHDDKGRLEQAAEDYSMAIQLNPNYASPYYNWGNVYAKETKNNEAIQKYSRAIELDPYDCDAYFNRAAFCALNGNFDQTMRDCCKIIELDPHDTRAYNKRAAVLAYQGKLDAAIKDIFQVFVLDPNDLEVYVMFIMVLRTARDKTQTFSNALELIRTDLDQASFVTLYEVLRMLQKTIKEPSELIGGYLELEAFASLKETSQLALLHTNNTSPTVVPQASVSSQMNTGATPATSITSNPYMGQITNTGSQARTNKKRRVEENISTVENGESSQNKSNSNSC